MIKVTVYITSYNYGKYLTQAVDSVLAQNFKDWELLIINDGSTDNTRDILAQYEGHKRIKIIHQENKGLNVSNNIALRVAQGNYIMRLDADDYLDENALLVLSNVLDTNEEVGLVYPDYYVVDEAGDVLEIVRRKKIEEEVALLDLPAHGACTMIRKECLLSLGGYDEKYRCQDGYDLWIRFLMRFKPYNVNVPLFYYRKHPKSLTSSNEKILKTRQEIKRSFVKNHLNNEIPKVLAIIPAIQKSNVFAEIALKEIGGKPLIRYTLDAALATPMIDQVVVTSDNRQILEYAAKIGNIETILRSPDISKPHTRIEPIVLHVLNEMETRNGYSPDAVMLLFINAPLRRKMHIEKAIDTMAIYGVDSIVSVTEELAYCYHHERNGLVPIQNKRSLRLERKAIYKENGAIFLSRIEKITSDNFLGKKIGHIVMMPEESIKIDSRYSFWQADKILSEWRTGVAKQRMEQKT